MSIEKELDDYVSSEIDMHAACKFTWHTLSNKQAMLVCDNVISSANPINTENGITARILAIEMRAMIDSGCYRPDEIAVFVRHTCRGNKDSIDFYCRADAIYIAYFGVCRCIMQRIGK